jgi:hypothetical protein
VFAAGPGFLTGAIRSRTTSTPTITGAPRPASKAKTSSNLALVDTVQALAAERGIAASQLALAWVLSRGGHIVPIPGTTRRARLDENLAALQVNWMRPRWTHWMRPSAACRGRRTLFGQRHGQHRSLAGPGRTYRWLPPDCADSGSLAGAQRVPAMHDPVSGNAALRSVTLGNLSFLITPSEACMSCSGASPRFRHRPRSRQASDPTLSWPHLIALGIGAIVGTGIYTLIGVGANLAGPAVLISFAIAGAVCACAALSYAELSTMMPAAGSAYTYSYSALGEVFAWVVGWSLILEYSLVVSTVAVGWSGYFVGFLEWVHSSAGTCLPAWLAAGPHVGRHDQPAGDLHHLAGGRHADGRHQERHAQCHPGGVQADRAGDLRGRGAAAFDAPTCSRSCRMALPSRWAPMASSAA